MSSMIKINQLLASENTVKDNNEHNDKTDQLQMLISGLKVSKCVLEEHLLSSSQSSSCGKSNRSPQCEVVELQ